MAVLPETVGALVKAVEERLVCPFEVEHQPERLAHADVLEDRAAQAEEEALRAVRPAVGPAFLHHPPPVECRNIVACRPFERGEFGAGVVAPAPERPAGPRGA